MSSKANMRASRIVAAVVVLFVATAFVSCSTASRPVAEANNRGADGGTEDATGPGAPADGGTEDATLPGAPADGGLGDTAGPDARADGGAETGSSSSTIPWNGGNFYLYGVNYPWLSIGVDFGSGPWGHLANPAQVMTDMATFAKEGGHCLRWWLWVDGRYDPLFGSNGQVTGLDPQFFSDLDTELQYAANNHVYLDLTLLDTSVLDVAQVTNGVQEGGHRALVTDPTVQQSFLDNALKPLLQHIAASSYKDYVLAYDIMNEPERLLPGGWGPSADFVAVNQLQTFVKNCAGYIHTYGGGALATVGSAAKTWMGLGLDFYCAHYNSGPGGPSGLQPPPAYASLGLDKPVVVEEFTTADVSFGLNDTAQWSAKWWLDTIYNEGYAGALGWAWHDSAGNWSSFQPVFTAWGSAHSAIVGPH